MMLFMTLLVPCLLSVLATALVGHLQDVEITTITSSYTVTEHATLTATQIINATEAVVVENVTVTATRFDNVTTTTLSTTLTSSSSSVTPLPKSSGNHGFIVTAFSPGTAVNGLLMQAAGLTFWLGGSPATYCPEIAQKHDSCPAGNTTNLGTCSMAVLVPGGQSIYAAVDGKISYTQAHSAMHPRGNDVPCPFRYKCTGGLHGELLASPRAFGASGLMACPAGESSWQVFLDISNATVPSGDVADCIKFDALTTNATQYGAWQYT